MDINFEAANTQIANVDDDIRELNVKFKGKKRVNINVGSKGYILEY